MCLVSDMLIAGDIICVSTPSLFGWRVRAICKADHDHESQVYADERGKLKVLHIASPVNRSYDVIDYIDRLRRNGCGFYVIRPRFLSWAAVYVRARYQHEFSEYCEKQVGKDYPERDIFLLWLEKRVPRLSIFFRWLAPSPAPYCIEATVQGGAQTKQRFVARSCIGVKLVGPQHIQQAVKDGDYLMVCHHMKGEGV